MTLGVGSAIYTILSSVYGQGASEASGKARNWVMMTQKNVQVSVQGSATSNTACGPASSDHRKTSISTLSTEAVVSEV